MALKDKVPALLQYIKNHKTYLDQNAIKLDIYEGNLLDYVKESLQRTLSTNYYEKIQERIIPINVLPRIISKTSKAYETAPTRLTDTKYQEDLSKYEALFAMNSNMNLADRYANLFKGYALEPFLHEGNPKLRVLPYDRFLPYSDDPVDSTNVTVFIKFMGKRSLKKNNKEVVLEVYHIYSKDEFISIDSDGDVIAEDMVLNEGINPYGVIPFYYGNRGINATIPIQDSDIISLVKIIPTHLTDLSGAILFQCFSITWGIDVNSENLTMSPNAFWSFKSDPTSDKTPSVGTIKPEADIEKVINFIMTTFALWLETRGIRVGSMGTVNAGNLASGISKLIDEMDTTSLIIESQNKFASEEPMFWEMFRHMNNYWVTNSLIDSKHSMGLLNEDFKVTITLDEPEPVLDRRTEVETEKLEMDSGFTSRRRAIVNLNPNMSPEQVDELIKEIDAETTVVTTEEAPIV